MLTLECFLWDVHPRDLQLLLPSLVSFASTTCSLQLVPIVLLSLSFLHTVVLNHLIQKQGLPDFAKTKAPSGP